MNYGYNPFTPGYGQGAQYAQQAAQQAYAQQMYAQQMAQRPAQPDVIARLVTSRDEATTAQIPFDSTINVFVNLAAGEVYIKRFNPATGGAIFTDCVDAAKAQRAQDKAQPEYATVDRVAALERRMDALTGAAEARGAEGG